MKIGELARLAGTSTKTIRFYEDAGLLPAPARTRSGYRDYEPSIAERLRFIHRGQAAGLSLAEVRQILTIHDRGEAPCRHVRQVLHTRLDQVRGQLAELIALEGHIQTLLEHAEQGQPTAHDQAAVCWILESEIAARPRSKHGDPVLPERLQDEGDDGEVPQDEHQGVVAGQALHQPSPVE